jgi:hypothetical protein
MGKVTGFLEIDRRDRRYAPASDRIRHYKEFVIPLSEEATRDQAARCMNCGIPYCHNGCPVNNQIPDWNDLVYKGDWEEAARNLHTTNNFPEFTGRICPAPCEASCTLNLTDQSVTIKTIECSIVDRAWSEGWIKPEVPKTKTGKKVAVIGSGPAGMACAQRGGELEVVVGPDRAQMPTGLFHAQGASAACRQPQREFAEGATQGEPVHVLPLGLLRGLLQQLRAGSRTGGGHFHQCRGQHAVLVEKLLT